MTSPPRSKEQSVFKKYDCSESDLATLANFERCFGIDKRFPALKNFVVIVQQLLLSEINDTKKHPSVTALNLALKNLNDSSFRNVREAANHRNYNTRHVLEGKFRNYPQASFLLAEFPRLTKEITISLKLLLLLAKLLRPDSVKDATFSNFRLTATEFSEALNQCFGNPTSIVEFIQKIPDYVKTLRQSHLDKIRTFADHLSQIQKLVFPLLPQDEKVKELVKEPTKDPSNISTKTISEHTHLYIRKDMSLVDDVPDPSERIIVEIEQDISDQESSNIDVQDHVRVEIEKSKHWISRHSQLPSTTSRRFTKFEKKHFENGLISYLNSGSQHDKFASIILFLMYVTGQTLEKVFNFRLGDSYDLTRGGFYHRKIHLPEGAYSPVDHGLDEYFENIADSLLLALPEPLVNALSPILSGNVEGRTLLETTSLTEYELTELVKKTLAKIRNCKWERITLAKIPTALGVEMTLAYRDKNLTYLVTGSENHEAPTQGYYLKYPTHYVQNAYSKTLHKLLPNFPPQISEKGANKSLTGPYVKRAVLRQFIQDIRVKISEASANGDLIAIHNTMVDYCVCLLLCTTGHRAVKDPFAYLSQFDLENRMLLINDKVISENQAWRLVALPQVAAEQVQLYIKHLKALASRFNTNVKTRNLAKQITSIFEKSSQQLPLFFYLTEEGNITWFSVSAKAIADRIKPIWPLPVGLFRHINANELLRQSNRADWVEIQLGHIDGVSHPYGCESSRVPLDELSEIGKRLDQAFRTLGFEACSTNIRGKSSSCVKADSSIKAKPFGHKIREKTRHSHHKNSSTLIRREIRKWSEKRNSDQVSEKDLHELQSNIVSECNKSYIDTNTCLSIFYRLLRKFSRSNKIAALRKLIFTIQPEDSPFNEISLSSYKECSEFRLKFIQLLNNRGKSGYKKDKSDRLAEIIFSSALIGRISSETMLSSIEELIYKSCFRNNQDIWLEFRRFSR